MKYLEYPDIPHTYVMHYVFGDGLPSDQGGHPFEEGRVIYSCDDYDLCMSRGREWYPKPTSWEVDGFGINVNISVPAGRKLYDEYLADLACRQEYREAHPEEYDTVKVGDYTLHVQKNSVLADNMSADNLPAMFLLMPGRGLINPHGPDKLPAFRPITNWHRDDVINLLGKPSKLPRCLREVRKRSAGAIRKYIRKAKKRLYWQTKGYKYKVLPFELRTNLDDGIYLNRPYRDVLQFPLFANNGVFPDVMRPALLDEPLILPDNYHMTAPAYGGGFIHQFNPGRGSFEDSFSFRTVDPLSISGKGFFNLYFRDRHPVTFEKLDEE